MAKKIKRALAIAMSIVLVVGLMPVPAFAALRTQELSLAESVIGPVDVTIDDANLYDALTVQLDDKGIAYEGNDETRHVALTAEANASLTSLSLNNKAIEDLSGLGAFTGLTWLNLSHNKIKSAGALASLTRLEHLDLYDNFVHDFSWLSGLTALTHLNLGDNNEVSTGTLTGLDAIEGLTALVYLDFSRGNDSSIVGHLSNLTNLEFLNLQQNGIADVTALAGLTKLKTLILFGNKVSGVSALAGLTSLEELNLQDNQLYQSGYGEDESGIDALFDESGELRLTKLKKLDLWGNWNWSGFMGASGKAHTRKLQSLCDEDKLEFCFFYDRIDGYEVETHRDGDVTYVTYDDFGAYRDGVRDDFNAMRNAHRYANEHGCEVRGEAKAGKPYHVFRLYDTDFYAVYTNVDWEGADFVVHDEDIDGHASRFSPLLCLSPSPTGATSNTSAHADIKTIEGSVSNPVIGSVGFGKASTGIAGLSAEVDNALAELNAKGYSRYYVMFYNAGKKQYIRFGKNQNSGSDQWDGFIVDGSGAFERTEPAPVQWDFDAVTKVVITPIPAARSYIRKGNFVTNPLASKTETPSGRGSKPIYFLRNLQVQDTANFEIANITQTVGTAAGGYDNNNLSGSYTGFFQVRRCADVDMHDCTVWARRYDDGGRSTYGISPDMNVNLSFTRVSCSNPWEHMLSVGGRRWGVTGTNHNKHVLFDSCTLNRIDAHEGFYDLTARDCTLGDWGFRLTGQGPLTIERCDVYADSFITLRSDYGSTWDGDARIIDCTHHYYRRDSGSHNLISVTASFDDGAKTQLHDFGYELHHPNLYVKNLTVDDSLFVWGAGDYAPMRTTYGILSNFSYEGCNADLLPADYWPDTVVVDGVSFVNYQDTIGYEPRLRMPLNETGGVMEKVGDYHVANVTYEGCSIDADVMSGEQLIPEPVDVETSVDGKRLILRPFTTEALGSCDVAVEYSGTTPTIVMADSKWKGWTEVSANSVSYGEDTNVAYFTNFELTKRWADSEGSTWTSGESTGTVGPLGILEIRTGSGTAHVEHVALLSHRHTWGDWQQTMAPTCAKAGAKQRVCRTDGAHVESREIPALGHEWEAFSTVDVPATYEAPGSESVHCAHCGAQKPGSEVVIPQLAVPTVKLSKVKAGKRSFTAKWKRAAGVSGYQLQYTAKKKGFKGAKKATVKKAAATSKKVKRLKAGKKYRVRIRAFAMLGGKKYYSTWSKVKNVRVK